jgi:hypothetical protein
MRTQNALQRALRMNPSMRWGSIKDRINVSEDSLAFQNLLLCLNISINLCFSAIC